MREGGAAATEASTGKCCARGLMMMNSVERLQRQHYSNDIQQRGSVKASGARVPPRGAFATRSLSVSLVTRARSTMKQMSLATHRSRSIAGGSAQCEVCWGNSRPK